MVKLNQIATDYLLLVSRSWPVIFARPGLAGLDSGGKAVHALFLVDDCSNLGLQTPEKQ